MTFRRTIAPLTLILIALAVVAAVLAVSGFLLGRGRERARQAMERAAARDEASQIRKRAREEAESIKESALLAGKEEAFRLREAWEKEEDRRREEIERLREQLENVE